MSCDGLWSHDSCVDYYHKHDCAIINKLEFSNEQKIKQIMAKHWTDPNDFNIGDISMLFFAIHKISKFIAILSVVIAILNDIAWKQPYKSCLRVIFFSSLFKAQKMPFILKSYTSKLSYCMA